MWLIKKSNGEILFWSNGRYDDFKGSVLKLLGNGVEFYWDVASEALAFLKTQETNSIDIDSATRELVKLTDAVEVGRSSLEFVEN